MLQEKQDRLYARYRAMFDPLYSISICEKQDIDEVADFIDKYWKKNHALVLSRKLMDWQYFNKTNNTYNFVIARSKDTQEIHAIEGFIPTTQFDSDIATPMTWGAIWKTRADVAPPGLGMVVKMYREHEYQTPYYSEIGISKDAEKYNEQLGNTVYSLESWYMPNKSIEDYKLINIKSTQHDEKICTTSNVKAKDITTDEWDKYAIDTAYIPPFKSKKYYKERYLNHPFYEYKVMVLTDGKDEDIFFYRIIEALGSKCIFFVDYIGSGQVMKTGYHCFQELMRKHESEYILFLCNGVNERSLLNAGFCNRRNTEDIVPVYYEPFLKQNVDILCASRYTEIAWPSFKGDADQDRPNVMKEN